MVFCNTIIINPFLQIKGVTILILIDGFLQFMQICLKWVWMRSHNPYFNRWFSAMMSALHGMLWLVIVTILILIDGFLQLGGDKNGQSIKACHNPYFNRWFSAMKY